MGLFQRIFGRRRPPQAGGFWETLTAYSPAFTSWGGELYESELVRAAIDARARNISKLAPTFVGSAQSKLRAAVRGGPNELQVWSQFLYRLSTILDMQGTAFVVPLFDNFGDRVGYFPVLPASSSLSSDSSAVSSITSIGSYSGFSLSVLFSSMSFSDFVYSAFLSSEVLLPEVSFFC